MSIPILNVFSIHRRCGRHWAIRVLPLSLVCLVIVLLLNFSSITSRIGGATSTSESKFDEPIYPRPDGSKDFNLRKDGTTTFNGFSFYLMGDTPYRQWQEVRLEQQIVEMKEYVKNNPNRNISFTVHVGDIQKVDNTKCAESSYERVASLLKKGPLPTLLIPGDNDWYDCPDRQGSFQLFMKYFGKFETMWHKADYQPLDVQRSEDNPELFVFYVEGILFVGIHLINAPPHQEEAELWDARMKMNKEWLALNVETYFEQYEIRGVIIFGHSLRSPRTRPFFLSASDYFLNITHRAELPVLYLHGDGHKWDVDQKLSHQLHWKHYVDIQVDQGGMAPPVIVDIAPQIKGKLNKLKETSTMQLVVGRGLVRIDRQGGLYDDVKTGDNDDDLKRR